ncbi:transposase [Methylococcus geothermalis]|uniref:transposase n=1 Tax=Methylococcus geothermalis TaxID=2681310 RepID=UPI00226A22AA|nr:transposase [Methylococcus geothermalis]
MQRGNNRQAIFFHEDDYGVYLDYLREALEKNDCKLYAFVLMTNHSHLLTLGMAPGGVSGLMQSVGRRYVRYVNATYRRSGTLFEGRFKSSLVDSERYLLTCMRYIELNPSRAGMVRNPGDYRWSSYRPHVGESVMGWLAEPEEYRRLAARPETRALAYRELFRQPLATDDLEAIRTHLNKGCALGASKFQDEIEAMAGRRAKIVPRGRPRKPKGGGEK